MKTDKKPRDVPVGVLFLALAVLVGGTILCFPIDAWRFAPAFPLGLVIVFARTAYGETISAIAGTAMVASYVIYLFLVVALLRVRKWRAFGVVFATLACLLLLNIVGCHDMVKGLH